MKKTMAILLTGLMVVGAFSGCAGKDASKQLNTSGEYVASAGEIKVPKEAFQFMLFSVKSNYDASLTQYGMTEEQKTEYWNTEREDGVKFIDSVKEFALKSAEELFATVQIAESKGIKADKKEVADTLLQVDNHVKSLGEDGTNAEEAFKKQTGITVAEMKAMYNVILQAEAYKKTVAADQKASSEEVRAYYDEHASEFIEDVTIQHILLGSADPNVPMTEEEKKVAKETADEVLKKVQTGGDMKELAATYSTDGGSKDNSGEYTFGRGQMVPEFEDWAFAAKEGDTGIVESQYGYHVMKYISGGGVKPFQAAFQSIQTTLDEEKVSQAIEAAIEELGLTWETNEEVYKSVGIE